MNDNHASHTTEVDRSTKKSSDPADMVLSEIEEMGKKSFIPSIGPVKGRILADIVREHKPRLILEVGALYGYSAILIAKNSPDMHKSQLSRKTRRTPALPRKTSRVLAWTT